jgi:hypothetical protein
MGIRHWGSSSLISFKFGRSPEAYVQKSDQSHSKQDEKSEVRATSISEDGAARVNFPVTPWVWVVQIIVGFWVVWRDVCAP